MSLSYRQRRCLRRTRRTLRLSEPRLTSMMIMFARLNAGEAMPARERLPRRLPAPVRATAHAVWAVLRWCVRVLVACACLLRPLGRLLGRPLRPCGRLLGRIALAFLIRCSFLPAGFRLIVGGWLASAHASAPSPPTAHRRNG